MITVKATTQTASVIVGEDDTQFTRNAQTVLDARGEELISAPSMEAAANLFATRSINLVILNLKLNRDETNKIIHDIRQRRPEIKAIAASEQMFTARPFKDCVKNNFYLIAKETNASVTVQQLENAIDQLEHRVSTDVLRKVSFGAASLGIIAAIAFFCPLPLAKFLGAFWVTLLAIEFGHYLIFCRRPRRFQAE